MVFNWILSILLLLSGSPISDSKLEIADRLSAEGKFELAAEAYEKAWLENSTSPDLIEKAGDNYMKARMYERAASSYMSAIGASSTDHFINYKHGLALKQTGDYILAIAAFNTSLNIETGQAYLLKEMISKEISGCEMAMKLIGLPSSVKVSQLNEDVNSPASEFAAIPVSSNILYYGSYKDGSSKIYRTVYVNDNWIQSDVADVFEAVKTGNYAGGSFNKDMSQFYFSICEQPANPIHNGASCKIFRTEKSKSGWVKPKEMRDYINWPNASSAHPNIVYEGDTEILYFSSDREGGMGGMDIWYATREVNSDDIDFTFPRNAGSTINTMKDDVTPFYDREKGMLFFSSNGHENIGGLDIFSSNGKRDQWSKPQNMGNPVNSNADDYYYASKLGTESAYITSNRLIENGKKTTADDDIFEINFDIEESTDPIENFVTNTQDKPLDIKKTTVNSNTDFTIRGRITDVANNAVLQEVYVTLYRAIGEAKRKRVELTKSIDGKYKFNLKTGEFYIVEAYKPGYEIGNFEFDTEELESGVSLDIPLTRANAFAIINKPKPTVSEQPKVENNLTSTPSSSLTSTTPNNPIETKPAVVPSKAASFTPAKIQQNKRTAYTQGTEYRIQLTAVKNYNPDLPLFSKARKYGQLGTELHPNGQLTRVFLRSFETYDQARALIDTMKAFGFDTAFVVTYQDGIRKS